MAWSRRRRWTFAFPGANLLSASFSALALCLRMFLAVHRILPVIALTFGCVPTVQLLPARRFTTVALVPMTRQEDAVAALTEARSRWKPASFLRRCR
jgi:hypothetical protein